MELLRMVSVDGKEWGEVQDGAVTEVDHEAMGLGLLCAEPTTKILECLGYEN